MLLDLNDLALRGGGRFERDYPLQPAPIVLGGVTYEVVVPEGVLVVVDRVVGGFLVHVSLKARVYGPCARCLAEATMELEAEEQEFVPTAKDGWERSEVSEFVEGFVVDIDGLAREALVLSMPAQILCMEECKGLCPQCGYDLNRGDCECWPAETDSRWDRLKDLKSEG